MVRPNVIVAVGASVEITIELVLADVAEEVIVSASTPVLDVKRQGNVTNFDQVMLNEVPTPRDPWALMQHLPGVTIARPNVGGSESTNQAQFTARGDNGTQTMWNLDGVTITDMAAVGASTTYFDFNVFEEVQFTTGGLDSRQQTGGLGINLVSKRGSNAFKLGARTYFSNDDLQGENISDDLRAVGLSGNRISQLGEYGADAGGPVWDNRVWFWTGISRTDVRQIAINGFPDEGDVTTIAARGDAQLDAATRLSLLYHRAEKSKAGRGAGLDRPPETTWNQNGPAHIYKAEASHIFAPSLFLSAKFAYVDLVFGLTPESGLDAQAYLDAATGVWHGGFNVFKERSSTVPDAGRRELGARPSRTKVRRPSPADDIVTKLSVSLAMARRRRSTPSASVSRRELDSPISRARRQSRARQARWAFMLGDVMAFDRWTIDAGVRVDWQRARNEPSSAPANGLAPAILPALEYPGGPYHTWTDFSPRLGVTFRATTSTIVRGSYARYASQLGSPIAIFDNPALMGTIRYTFRDVNGDHLAQVEELLGPTGFVMNVNPANPAAGYSPNQVDPNLRSPVTQVLVGGIEREVVSDFSLGVNVGSGVTSSTHWSPFIGLTSDHFEEYLPRSRQACRSRHRCINWRPV